MRPEFAILIGNQHGSVLPIDRFCGRREAPFVVGREKAGQDGAVRRIDKDCGFVQLGHVRQCDQSDSDFARRQEQDQRQRGVGK
jgi:hypothetical protein